MNQSESFFQVFKLL